MFFLFFNSADFEVMSSTETESELSDFYSSSSSSSDEEEDPVTIPVPKKVRTRGGYRRGGSNISSRPVVDQEKWVPYETAPFEPNIPPFTSIPGPTTEPKDTVVQFVEQILTDEFIQLIVDQTNLYATQFLDREVPTTKSRSKEWKEVTIEDIRKYISLSILMSIHTLPSIPDYWSTNTLKYNSVYKKTMSRNRYVLFFYNYRTVYDYTMTIFLIAYSLCFLSLLCQVSTHFKVPSLC